jgi:hypothetical protein
MSTSAKDPGIVYRRFIEFEEEAAAIYLHFASHFSEDHQLSAFWLDMGMQEKQHAGLLQFCLADSLFAADLPDRAEIEEIAGLFKQWKKQAADPELSLEEAFTIAMELETSEINGIYRHLTTPLHPSVYLLRRKIMTCLDHVDEVIKAASKFGVKNETMKELVNLRKICSEEWKRPKRVRPAS